MLRKIFNRGYCDGHGQAIDNVRYNIVQYILEHKKISIAKINEICDMCSKVDDQYLDTEE